MLLPFWRDLELPAHRKAQAAHMIETYIRMFEPISRIEPRRAVWCFLYRQENCDPLFRKFMAVCRESDLGWWQLPYTRGRLADNPLHPLEGLDILRDAVWRVSCHISRCPSPSPPPPPYNLFDITLPTENFALVYQATPMLPPFYPPCIEDREVTTRGTKRKRVIRADHDASRTGRKRSRKGYLTDLVSTRGSQCPRITEFDL